MRLDMLALLLAGWAIVARTLPLIEVAHLRAANPASLGCTLVDKELLAKITRRAIGADVVSQGRTTEANRRAQHRAHGAH